jgi:RNA polymerase sigma-70 factor (ECF subfamily)
MANGDRQALVELYDRFSPILYSLAARILQDRREAEDLLHDVILEAWQNAAQYSAERGKVVTWLTLRMRSRALDRVRSPQRKRTTLSDDPARDELASESTAPDASADRRTVRDALELLPAEQKQVLELAYFGGLSSSEIAAHLEISLGTVKSRTAAGLTKLRARLKGGEP